MSTDSLHALMLQWWWAWPVLLSLIWVWAILQLHSKQQKELIIALQHMDQKRTAWIEQWRARLDGDQSQSAHPLRGALAAVAAAQKQAATNWLDADCSEALLHMEWFFDRSATVWAYNTRVRSNEDDYEKWRTEWEHSRSVVNPIIREHNQFFNSLLGHLLARIAGRQPAIDWLDENAHRRRQSDIDHLLSNLNH